MVAEVGLSAGSTTVRPRKPNNCLSFAYVADYSQEDEIHQKGKVCFRVRPDGVLY